MTREEAIDIIKCLAWHTRPNEEDVEQAIKALEQEPKTGHCKDCKWWKDSDGEYRRGVRAESRCPINRKEVYEGNGYCFLYEPQESEDKE